jgi:two-component system, chemotaxis family, protein-glutamate methylesterase/glutaminase
MNRIKPDHVVRLAEMPELLGTLVAGPTGPPRPVPDSIRYEVEIARGRRSNMNNMDGIGRRSVLSCPDCGGVMWEIDEDNLVRYRCHVGHAYTAEEIRLALDENLRRALTTAERALEERVALASKLHSHAIDRGHRLVADTWAEKASEFEHERDVIRSSIRRMDRMVAQSSRKPETVS